MTLHQCRAHSLYMTHDVLMDVKTCARACVFAVRVESLFSAVVVGGVVGERTREIRKLTSLSTSILASGIPRIDFVGPFPLLLFSDLICQHH